VNPLPNYAQAVIEDSKLADYALNPESERGRHKARVFERTLGFNLSNWEKLRQAILSALPYYEATFVSETSFGKKYKVILPISGVNERTVDVVTIWQYDRRLDGALNEWPRLVTIYISL
jgi:hypothetical protein